MVAGKHPNELASHESGRSSMRVEPRRVGVVSIAVLVAIAGVLALAGRASAAGPSVSYNYDGNAPVAQADVPLRIVLVGFKKGQLDERRCSRRSDRKSTR